MRPGGDYFTEPSGPAQRRYEALRAYFVEELSAAEVAGRFGYSPRVVHQMASELRQGRAEFFASSKPGPRGARKVERIRDRVLELRAGDRSVTEIAQALRGEGTPVSAQTVWSILAAEGLERLERRAAAERGAPPRLSPVKARALAAWPAGEQVACDHAGLLLLVPGLVELGLDELVSACGYPSTNALSAWHSLGTLLLAKCARQARVSHADALADDRALALLLGLTALPKATHLTSYSYRARRQSNEQLQAALCRRLRELGLATGDEGFNLDFHAIRHHGADTPPTLLITNDLQRTSKQLFARYAQRMGIENELDAYISGFHLDALSSGLPLNVDLDTTLTVIAGNLYRLLARRLPRYQHATPDRIWRHFLDSTGTLHVTDDTLTLDLRVRTYHPVLIDAGLADQATTIPWLDGRKLRFHFPAR